MAFEGKEAEELSEVPYGEPYWYGTAPGGGGSSSPYYTEKHEAFRAKVRPRTLCCCPRDSDWGD